jgi:anti-anti-sigma factor
MEITDKKTDKAIIVEINGRIDAVTTSDAEQYLNSLVDNNDSNIVIDCKNLDYINSSGLRILIMNLKKQTARNKKLLLCNLQKNIKDVFKFSGFTNLFDVEMDMEGALQQL